MISIRDKKNCCGCTACYSICPVEAIRMEKDEEGFLYPIVSNEQCIRCGKCTTVCPINKKDEVSSEVVMAIAVQHHDTTILYHSAAGGAFSAIGEMIINKNGIVYGAGYDEQMVVTHSKAETVDELVKFRSSKYVQSDQNTIFKSIKDDLRQGRVVCYSGTPCQVAGLRSFLGKDYTNLFTVDLVCKGVGSPEILKQYVKLLEAKYDSKIIGINFKRKTYGYHSSTMSIDFANGREYSRGGITDLMMRPFRANICLRPSCGECHFKGINRQSDLTIFDCWHYTDLTKKKDDDRGHTAVIVHSQKGLEILKGCTETLDIDPINIDDVIKLDGIMVCEITGVHPNRETFMHVLRESGLEEAIAHTIPISFKDKLIDSSKGILYKLGLLSLVKKLK